jgi:serine/threonine protein kinase
MIDAAQRAPPGTTPPSELLGVQENALRYFWQQILECVAVCHDHSVLHLDLKPSNFVSVGGQLKIIDFGIARNLGQHTNVVSESALGTINYMSPESLETLGGQAQATVSGGPAGWKRVFFASLLTHLRVASRVERRVVLRVHSLPGSPAQPVSTFAAFH